MIEILGQPNLASKISIKQTANACMDSFKIGQEKILEILFVGQEKMRELNFIHRKINKSTDVLSFPQSNIKADKQIFGSIVICEETAKELDESDNSLVQHGFLHLVGYDHETNVDEWDKAVKLIK